MNHLPVLLMLLLSCSSVFAQTADSGRVRLPRNYWIQAGGIVTTRDDLPGVQLGIVLEHDEKVVSNINIQAAETFGGLNIEGGKILKRRRSQIIFTGGAAILFYVQRDTDPEHRASDIPYVALGVPLMAQYLFVFSRFAGVGVSGTLTVSRKITTASLGLTVALGRLRLEPKTH